MTVSKHFASTLLSCALVCSGAVWADSKHAPPAGKIAATVNDRPISQMAADRVIDQLKAQGQNPDQQQIMDELINLELLTQEAEKRELNKSEEVATALHLQYTQTMANAYLAAYSNDYEVEEDVIRAEYEKQIAQIKSDEYKASHILVEEESVAKEVIEKLAAGQAFAELAKEYSVGPTSVNGGDLGWFQPQNMVPEFSDAVAKLEKGESTTAPVQTQFGWHVIFLEDTRSAAKPDYSPQVKAGIKNTLLRDALAKHVEELRANAKIEMSK